MSGLSAIKYVHKFQDRDDILLTSLGNYV